MSEQVDTSDPGLAARVAWAAAVLYARVSGYNAENQVRERSGSQLAYWSDSYEVAIEEAHKIATGQQEASHDRTL